MRRCSLHFLLGWKEGICNASFEKIVWFKKSYALGHPHSSGSVGYENTASCFVSFIIFRNSVNIFSYSWSCKIRAVRQSPGGWNRYRRCLCIRQPAVHPYSCTTLCSGTHKYNYFPAANNHGNFNSFPYLFNLN